MLRKLLRVALAFAIIFVNIASVQAFDINKKADRIALIRELKQAVDAARLAGEINDDEARIWKEFDVGFLGYIILQIRKDKNLKEPKLDDLKVAITLKMTDCMKRHFRFASESRLLQTAELHMRTRLEGKRQFACNFKKDGQAG